MAEDTYKTTYSPREVQQKKETYLEKKKVLVQYLKDISDLLEAAGDNPLHGNSRETLMNKFSMIDHRLLDAFDVSSFAYFEAQEAAE